MTVLGTNVLLAAFVFSFLGIHIQAQAQAQTQAQAQVRQAVDVYNAGLKCHHAGDIACAFSSYERAIGLKEDFPQAHQNIALLYEAAGGTPSTQHARASSNNLAKALYHHRQSVDHAPDIDFAVGAWCNLIRLELRLISFPGQLDDVQYATNDITSEGHTVLTSSKTSRLAFFVDKLREIASRLLPKRDTNLLFTLAKVFLELQDYTNSIKIFQELLLLDPLHSMALLNVGNHYFRLSDFERACEYYTETVRVVEAQAGGVAEEIQNLVMALNNLGQSFRQMGQLDPAIKSIERALAYMRSVENSVAIDKGLELWSTSNIFAMRGLGCQWDAKMETEESFLEKAVLLQAERPLDYIAPSLSNGIVDPYTFSLSRFASRSSDLLANKIYCLPYNDARSKLPLSESVVRSGGQIKLGYLSYDWRDHPMGRLTQRFVTGHKNSSRIASTSISYGPNDDSSVRKHVQAHSPAFLDIESIRSDLDASEIVRQLNLDVIVDLTSHTYNGRIAIAALSPAPIIINYLGYPGSSGCSAFDYSMVDKVVASPEFAADFFSERLIYLPFSYQANSMPLTVPLCLSKSRKNCRKRIASHAYKSGGLFHTWGSHERVWLCSFNAIKKLEPIAFAAWMNILRENPRAVLILLDLDEPKRNKIFLQALHHGVHPSRIVFIPNLPWKEHLYRSAACDLVLDTFVYGAHTTSSDVLWMSVPLLVLESFGSNRMPSRVAASITSSIHGAYSAQKILSISVARSVKEYESIGRRITKRDDLQQFTYVFHGQIAGATLRAPTFAAALMQESFEAAIQGVVNLEAAASEKRHHLILPPPVYDDDNKLQLLKMDALKQIGECVMRRQMQITLVDIDKSTGEGNMCSDMDIFALAGRLLASYPGISTASALRQLLSQYSAEAVKISCSSLVDDFINSLLRQRSSSSESFFMNVNDLLQCLLHEPIVTVSSLLDVQYKHLSRCAEESIIFEASSALLFERTSGFADTRHSIFRSLESSLPLLFNTTSPGWTALSPVLVLAESELVTPALKSLLSMVLSNHAVCMAKSDVETAALLLASSFAINPLSHRLFDLGLVIDNFNPELGFQIAANGSLAMHEERHASRSARSQNFTSGGDRHRVALYCYEFNNEWWGEWGPSSMTTGGSGAGGSEEAVVYLSEELVALGFDVTVYANPPEQDRVRGIVNGVRYRHHSEYNISESVDVFIAWRYTFSLAIGRNARLTILWLHDLVMPRMLPPPSTEKIDLILVQSSFHLKRTAQALFERGYEEQHVSSSKLLTILPNGIPTRNTTDEHTRSDRDVLSFVYGSSPSRGLEGLLKVAWPLIRAALPQAQLKVFYGFPPSVQRQYRKQMGADRFEEWHAYMNTLLVQPGVVYVGAVDHDTLTSEYSKTGFVLYPTRFPETGCITLMKAMREGAIPITSRFSDSVIPSLTSRFDLGPSQALDETVADIDTWLIEQFVPAVLRATALKNEELELIRSGMRQYILETHTWRNSALQLSTILENQISRQRTNNMK